MRHNVEPTHEPESETNPNRNPKTAVPNASDTYTTSDCYHQFGIRAGDAQLPIEQQFGDLPPPGFISVNKHMCSHGAIPPFNPFLEKLLRQLSIAPSQLHPNGYAILMGLCVLFMGAIRRLPTFEEINFLCTFAKGKNSPFHYKC